MIQLNNVSIKRDQRVILSEVSLSLNVGVHLILGPNGSGKSSLLRFLATVSNQPATGRAQLLGANLMSKRDRRSIRGMIGFAPQDFETPHAFSIKQLVNYVAILKEIDSKDIDRRTTSALATTGLESLQSRKLTRLSGGERQRANLAQAIVNDPQVVLLDEPTAGLDFRIAGSLRDDLYELGRSKCVVIATHLAADILSTVATVSVIDDGRVEVFSSFDEFVTARANYGY